jgi:4-amino-4-deoxy-L-arabinose transferase-like glycosyltransferase/putative flippase GtrA
VHSKLVEVVVPVYNEQVVLAASIGRLHRYLSEVFPYDFRITIADNASTDDTWRIATGLAAELPHVHAVHLDRKGRGRALRHVWTHSDADVVSYMDVDLSTGLDAFLPLVAPLLSGHSDLAIGTRLTRGSAVVRGFKREVISRSYNLLLRTTLAAHFSDAQCGFKAARTEVVQALLPAVEDDEWFFDTELLLLAESGGLRIHEVPVDWVDDVDSRVDIARTAMNDLRGMARVARRLCAPGGAALRVPRRAAAGMRRQLPSFAIIGMLSTIAYLLLYVGLRATMSALAANAVALFVTAVANTAANRRFTFGVTGSKNALRHQMEGGVAFLLSLLISSAGLALVNATDPRASRLTELSAVVACNVIATVARFILLRGWVFHPRRHGAKPAAGPAWARPALGAILVLAAVLYAWGLSRNGDANTYYAAAVLSGTKSWKAFFFGALDSGSFITVDKPPLALWVMGLSARIFGFGTWSLLLPQVLEGVAAVAVLYVAVRRMFGRAEGVGPYCAALVAALVLTLTPITVAINRDDNPDTLLVLLLVLAGWACMEAIRSGHWRPLLLCALAVGLAFNTKMMQAYLVVPALALAYLVAAPGGIGRRLGRLSVAGAVLVGVSLSWMTIVDLIPAGRRPYVGSSSNDTVWNVMIGYNGLGRIFGGEHPGKPVSNDSVGAVALRHFTGHMGGQAGPWRLFGGQIGGQISWLLPLAFIALAGALVLRGRKPRTDTERASLLLWGGWLTVHFVVFSFAGGIFHPYYTAAMAPAIAALTGVGGVALFRAYRRSVRWAWVLPSALAVTGAWSIVVLDRIPGFLPWLPVGVGAVTAVAVGTLIVLRLRGRVTARLVVAAATAGLAGALAGPAAFAVTPLSRPVQGNNPLAGPASIEKTQWMHKLAAFAGMDELRRGLADPRVVGYLRTHRDGATWLVAVPNAMLASPIILTTGQPVMAMGGFAGMDPALTVPKLQAYIRTGRLHYVLLSGAIPFGPMHRPEDQAVTAWVQRTCTVANPYGPAATLVAAQPNHATLYRCG